MMAACGEIGVIVVGDEILSGKRQDRHLDHVIEVAGRRGLRVAWCRYLGDDLPGLTTELRQTRAAGVAVVCFGGIGATPDDCTRQAAAAAFDRPLMLHPEAVALIEAQFGAEARPNRIRMAELPRGAHLIPNPITRIPGFSLDHHHFLPGFPHMAWPMLDWVLDTAGPQGATPERERSVQVYDVAESALIPLLEAVRAAHLDARLFSLPHMGDVNRIELGFRGPAAAVDPAFSHLVEELRRRGNL